MAGANRARRRPPRPQPRSLEARQRRLEAEARNRLTPCRGEQQRLEAQLSALAGERAADRGRTERSGHLHPTAAPEQQRLFRRQWRAVREIVQLEARWLEVMTALEERVS